MGSEPASKIRKWSRAPVLSRSKVSNASIFICLASVVALATASAQTVPTEPLEKYDNPPAYIYRLETSPRMISQYGPFTSFQVNVDVNGNNIVGDAGNEPSIAVDPTDGSKMAIGWRQFDSVGSNFREAGYGYTADGGETWTFPGVLQDMVFRSDPVLNSGEGGRFFYLSLESTQDLQFFCDDMWRSLNGGQSWTLLHPQRGARGGDKAWFTIDKTNGMGHGFQYQFWSEATACDGGFFNRSTDGGVTWQTPISIPNHIQWGTLDVDTNGKLFIGGIERFLDEVRCIRSSDAQNGNVTPSFDQVTEVDLGGRIVFGGPINPQGIAGQVFLAVDRSGTGNNNNIYMLASVQARGTTNGTNVMFVRSTDGGLTFSAPHRINDDPLNPDKWHWLGTLAVAPNGRIDSVWLDTRNAANNTDSQLFYSYSTDAGVTWSANVAVSNAFNPFEGYPNNRKMGDYITIVSDDTGGNVAYSATFNFNANRGEHEEDVYYVRVSPAAAAGCFRLPLQYYGGPIMRTLRIYPLYYGNWSSAEINAQQQYLSGLAHYLSGDNRPAGQQPMTWQYGVTGATVATVVRDNPNATPIPLSRSDLLNIIRSNQMSGKLPAFGPNTLIMVFPAHGFGLDCNGCGGYHSSESSSAFWAVVLQDAGPSLPLVTAHEVFEAAMDPADDNEPGWDESVDGCCTTINLPFGQIPGLHDNTQNGTCSTTGYTSTDEVQVYGWTYADYRAKYDELWPRGWRLYILQSYVRNGQVLYNAVWRRSTMPEIQVYGWSYADYRAKYDELWPRGWRLYILQSYVAANGQVLYNAVWRRGTVPEVQVYGWSYADYRAKYDELWPRGWRLYILQSYVRNGQVLYNAVWRRSTMPEIQVYGWSYADYRARYDELWPQGWRLYILQSYVAANGEVLYNAVWRPGVTQERPGTLPEVQVYGWSYADYRAKYDELWPRGWRLYILQSYVRNGQVLYNAVWRLGTVDRPL
jgi:hypothetical protein